MEAKSSECGINDKSRANERFCKKVKVYFAEYCNSTSIHGIRYFGEQERTFGEKIWWIVSITLSCACCFTLIYDTYRKWEKSPVIVSFATKEVPIWQIPFPAVTICPEIKSNPNIFNYTQILHKKQDGVNLTAEEDTYFGFMSLICAYRVGIEYETNNTIRDVKSDEIFDFYGNVTSNLKDQFGLVKFMNQNELFSDAFMPIVTDEGICYTFNMLSRKEMFTDIVQHYKDYHVSKYKQFGWNLESGYDIDAGRNVYPRRALYAGALSPLEIKMYVFTNETDYTCNGGLQGFKVQVHHPARMPRVRQQHFRLPLNQVVLAAITPKMIQTSDEVKAYNPKIRECYFPSERKLHFFKFYTQQNCQIECKTNYTLEECGCVNFYMPHDNSTLICGAANLECMIDAENDMLTNFITSKLNMLKHKKRKLKTKRVDNSSLRGDCDCLPVCTSIDYSVETSQTDWDWAEQINAERVQVEDENRDFDKIFRLSGLKIFFKTNQFIPSERHELYGPTDFVANFGGLMGLFTGFSVLSLVEIVYFLTLRIICNVKLYGKQFWSGIPPSNN